MGVLQGYGHATGCLIHSLNNTEILLKTTIKESPSMLFVDVELTETVMSSPQWLEAWQFMQKNKIAFCGVGKRLANKDEAVQREVFDVIFTLPLNIDKLHDFLHTRIFPTEIVSHERRYTERRRAMERRKMDRRSEDRRSEDRRKQIIEDEHVLNNIRDSGGNLRVGSLIIDYLGKDVSVGGVVIEISPKEFELIDLLARQAGRVVKTADIVKIIWPENYKATKADVHQYIHLLRKKIEKNPHEPHLLITVKGFGYKLCP